MLRKVMERSPLARDLRAQQKRSRASARDLFVGDPSGIRTRVTAVRGRRTRPLYDGAVYFFCTSYQRFRWSSSVIVSHTSLWFQIGGPAETVCFPARKRAFNRAGIPGLEPRMTVPETVVLPITPYPNGTFGPVFRASSLLRAPQHEKLLYPRLPARTNRPGVT